MRYLVRSGWKREKASSQVEEMKVGVRRVKKREDRSPAERRSRGSPEMSSCQPGQAS